ncbi:MAG: hypothetical protein ACK41C_00885 [Phenylobacterium sp.]|jgi:hypothetical protein|uniref:hypothetical protein n=1 Tax=Phenylobacterium sp. TaxID=1871053 RepID=UPI00391B89BB
MVQYAVTQKDGAWTVFRDGQPIERDISRSAGIELAKTLAFEAEERGETVELLIQGYTGELTRKVTGAD